MFETRRAAAAKAFGISLIHFAQIRLVSFRQCAALVLAYHLPPLRSFEAVQLGR